MIRESFDDQGNHVQIEIKKEFLTDYLAARNLSFCLTYYRQRVENVEEVESSEYAGLESYQEERDQGQFELLIRSLNDVYGGSWASFRVWRTDVDEEDDAPVMGPETNENTESESSQSIHDSYGGIRVEGEFWRDEGRRCVIGCGDPGLQPHGVRPVHHACRHRIDPGKRPRAFRCQGELARDREDAHVVGDHSARRRARGRRHAQ